MISVRSISGFKKKHIRSCILYTIGCWFGLYYCWRIMDGDRVLFFYFYSSLPPSHHLPIVVLKFISDLHISEIPSGRRADPPSSAPGPAVADAVTAERTARDDDEIIRLVGCLQILSPVRAKYIIYTLSPGTGGPTDIHIYLGRISVVFERENVFIAPFNRRTIGRSAGDEWIFGGKKINNAPLNARLHVNNSSAIGLLRLLRRRRNKRANSYGYNVCFEFFNQRWHNVRRRMGRWSNVKWQTEKLSITEFSLVKRRKLEKQIMRFILEFGTFNGRPSSSATPPSRIRFYETIVKIIDIKLSILSVYNEKIVYFINPRHEHWYIYA